MQAPRQKTTVYLDADALRAVKRLARAQARSEAEIIREAVSRYVAGAPRPRLRSIGAGKGPADLAARADDYLAGFGGRSRGRAGKRGARR